MGKSKKKKNYGHYRKCMISSCACYPQSEQIRCHSFPKEERMLSLWRQACKIDETVDTSNKYICGRHFSKDQYFPTPDPAKRTKMLKKNAVPNLMLSSEEFYMPSVGVEIKQETTDGRGFQQDEVTLKTCIYYCLQCSDSFESSGDLLNHIGRYFDMFLNTIYL